MDHYQNAPELQLVRNRLYSKSPEGVCILNNTPANNGLSSLEIRFLSYINATTKNEVCLASNADFATYFDLPKSRVSVIIHKLVKRGYLTSLLNKATNQRLLCRETNQAA